ncbi:MBL fold metallo-hydrolase [Frigidibacter oleivorans]|uniref:MBL fold metallo-hydrolase n=1 Tax=Frigidibacter oleivorans TaxID=2487129 RepID=UPI000F8DA121|nr:MBL fold metallo-hydrolase [Frigidibacter oleivorans]
MRFCARLAAALLLALATPLAQPAAAQDRIPSHCVALAGPVRGMEVLQRASFGAALPADTVRVNFVSHATFVIETAGGLTVATDYSGFLGPGDLVPDVVTMNNAHSTHWTDSPDPRIPHVLRGWGEGGKAASHHLDLGEILVRNVTTDIRFGGAQIPDGNSIFVFEVAGLCIGHLGHLHHEPTPAQYGLLGRMDVVLTPVDGSYTMDQQAMIRVMQRLRSSLVIPMHWFGEPNLQRFLSGMQEDFAVERPGRSWVEVSLGTLPGRPTVLVLEPRWLD